MGVFLIQHVSKTLRHRHVSAHRKIISSLSHKIDAIVRISLLVEIPTSM